MQAQDRPDASETLFIRLGSGHGHLQTACAMPEGANMFCRITSRFSWRTCAVHVLHHEIPLLIIAGVRAEIAENGRFKR